MREGKKRRVDQSMKYSWYTIFSGASKMKGKNGRRREQKNTGREGEREWEEKERGFLDKPFARSFTSRILANIEFFIFYQLLLKNVNFSLQLKFQSFDAS